MKHKIGLALIAGFFTLLQGGALQAEEVSLHQSVEQTLNYSPRLQMLKHNQAAVKYELEQSKGAYLPSVDMILGYGTDQYSDRSTRLSDSNPGNEDWDIRGEATLSLTQKLYDGGETKSRIAVREAVVNSVDYRTFDNAQSVALDAIVAHMNVYRQRELVKLAQKNVENHEDILESLDRLQQGGVGSIADVTQVQGRLARSQSSLYAAQAEAAVAEANYRRVTGTEPDDIQFAAIPENTPQNLEQALTATEQGNPKVLALNADIKEADARVRLAESAYQPKLNLELASSYDDQTQGDPSWVFANEAMVRMRWNLFNGKQDKYAVQAASSRKLQSQSSRDEQLIDVLEQTAASWAQYQAAVQQVATYGQAVQYNRETLDSYLKQFNVAQRSLLDVLDAENEYFQSSGQLTTACVNKVIAAYRLLALNGQLQVAEDAGQRTPDCLEVLAQEIPTFDDIPVVTASAVPSPEPAAEVVGVDPKASIQALLDSWELAWESRDISRYLGFYSPRYIPERQRTLEEWKAFRTRRLSQPENIELTLGTLNVTKLDNGNYRVSFMQKYDSNMYHDEVMKVLEFEPFGESWLIVKEVATPPNT